MRFPRIRVFKVQKKPNAPFFGSEEVLNNNQQLEKNCCTESIEKNKQIFHYILDAFELNNTVGDELIFFLSTKRNLTTGRLAYSFNNTVNI